MNSWSVVDKIQQASLPVLVVIVVGVMTAYFFRDRLALWLVRRGTSAASRIILEVMGIAGVDDPQWVLVTYPSRLQRRLGIVVRQRGTKVAVFVPSAPKLVPGQLVFVDAGQVKELRSVTFEDGLEALLTLGSASDTDVLNRIMAQLEE